ncbi:MAG: LysR family transcriptional regulator [Pseudomonadota bacterium]
MFELDRLDGLTVFMAVADRGGFAAAGAQLGLSRSAISLAVRRLEGRLGVTLFTRTTRSVGLTEAGHQLYERARPLLTELDASLADAADLGSGPSGTLKITVPRICVPLVIEPIVSEFARTAPNVTLEVVAQDGLADIVREGFDAGIRLGDQIDTDMVGLNLTGPLPWQIVASPDYLARHGTPIEPGDLAHHSCIGYRYTSSPGTYRWELFHNGRLTPFAVRGSVIVNDFATKPAMARQGLGLAYDLASTFAEDVRAGRLVPVLEAYVQTSDGFFLYYPHRHQMLPKLRAFIDVCKRHIRARKNA